METTRGSLILKMTIYHSKAECNVIIANKQVETFFSCNFKSTMSLVFFTYATLSFYGPAILNGGHIVSPLSVFMYVYPVRWFPGDIF